MTRSRLARRAKERVADLAKVGKPYRCRLASQTSNQFTGTFIHVTNDITIEHARKSRGLLYLRPVSDSLASSPASVANAGRDVRFVQLGA
jgi:hypothetical protein